MPYLNQITREGAAGEGDHEYVRQFLKRDSVQLVLLYSFLETVSQRATALVGRLCHSIYSVSLEAPYH